jgi:hypothetical protein
MSLHRGRGQSAIALNGDRHFDKAVIGRTDRASCNDGRASEVGVTGSIAFGVEVQRDGSADSQGALAAAISLVPENVNRAAERGQRRLVGAGGVAQGGIFKSVRSLFDGERADSRSLRCQYE